MKPANPGFAAAFCALLPATALAGVFDGSWKISADSIRLSNKPYVYLLTADEFTCSSCAPAFTIKPDGTEQKVSGHPDFDTQSVTVVDASTVKIIQKLNGKQVFGSTDQVSADGKVDHVEYTDYTGAEPFVVKLLQTRTSAAPAGSHALSGSWIVAKVQSVSGGGAINTYHLTDEGFSYSSNGQAYDAKFDGKKYPYSGDPLHTKVTVKKLGANEVEERDYRGGKLVWVGRMTVSADGKSLHVVGTDVPTGRVTRLAMDKVQ
jgi:hypothetical protein